MTARRMLLIVCRIGLLLGAILLLAACHVAVSPTTAVLPCDGSGVLLSATYDTESTYTPSYWQWYRDGVLIEPNGGSTYLATEPGTYWTYGVGLVPGSTCKSGCEQRGDKSNEVLVSPCSGDNRADVSVIIYGGWNGIPVQCSVGGTVQQTLYTAQDASGQAAVLWTFYPPNGANWPVQVAPQTPAGLDATRWQYRLVRIKSSGGTIEAPTSAALTLNPGGHYVIFFQLVDTQAGAAAN